MSIALNKKQSVEAVPTPPEGEIHVFRDMENRVKIKESSGEVRDPTADEIQKLTKVFGNLNGPPEGG